MFGTLCTWATGACQGGGDRIISVEIRRIQIETRLIYTAPDFCHLQGRFRPISRRRCFFELKANRQWTWVEREVHRHFVPSFNAKKPWRQSLGGCCQWQRSKRPFVLRRRLSKQNPEWTVGVGFCGRLYYGVAGGGREKEGSCIISVAYLISGAPFFFYSN